MRRGIGERAMTMSFRNLHELDVSKINIGFYFTSLSLQNVLQPFKMRVVITDTLEHENSDSEYERRTEVDIISTVQTFSTLDHVISHVFEKLESCGLPPRNITAVVAAHSFGAAKALRAMGGGVYPKCMCSGDIGV
ncbi:hypothetical protein AMTRI_Chr03g48290 [Amborella trichopoda]|uniref:Uncharacterized protein n=1 Tax=Amborella trichopoda TaxID=13333 RepID=W1PN46_AMBTC|nr:hypothetical protein AMTR_s00014p00175570 [Amborella trichopoda]